MSVNVDDLDPLSAEYEAEMQRRQDEEDQALGNVEVKQPQDETPQGAQAEDAQTDEPEDGKAQADSQLETELQPEQQPQSEKPETPEGVLSKDGKRVLSYGVLKSARAQARAEREARQALEAERDAYRKQLEDIKAGKTVAQQDDLTDDELASLAEDLPPVAKIVAKMRSTEAAIAELKAQRVAAPERQEPQDETDPVQEAIDSVPLLSEWQAADPAKFARAVEIDGVMKNSPKWRDKPLAERFAHVAAQVADEYDIEQHDDTQERASPQPKQQPNTGRTDPKIVIERAARKPPNTLSDFKGGAVEQTTERLDKMPAAKAVARMMDMTDEEIDAHLRKFG